MTTGSQRDTATVPPAAPQPAPAPQPTFVAHCPYVTGQLVPCRGQAAPQTPAEPVAYILDPGAGSASDRLVWARDVNYATEASRYKERGGSLTPLYASPHSAGPAPGSVGGGVVALDGAPATQCPDVVAIPKDELARLERARVRLYELQPHNWRDSTAWACYISEVSEVMWHLANRKWPSANVRTLSGESERSATTTTAQKAVAPDSVAPTLSGSGESSSPSVGSSVAEPTTPCAVCEAPVPDRRALHVCWSRHQRQATRDREVTMNDDTGETKDSVVVEADSNAVPSTLSVPRSSPK